MSKSSVVVLECQQVYKHYQEGKLAVDVLQGIELSLSAGEKIAIIGASGSGKSTLLHILGGLLLPNRGKVLVNGEDLQQVTAAKRARLRNRNLGFVYQFHHLLPEFTALENVALPLLLQNHAIAKVKQSAQALLSEIGLFDRIHHKMAQLSGGERQRVAIARALVNQPKCVLADEPTGNLDQRNAHNVMSLLLKLNQQIRSALVIVTHDETIAAQMDRVYQLVDGRLLPLS